MSDITGQRGCISGVGRGKREGHQRAQPSEGM